MTRPVPVHILLVAAASTAVAAGSVRIGQAVFRGPGFALRLLTAPRIAA